MRIPVREYGPKAQARAGVVVWDGPGKAPTIERGTLLPDVAGELLAHLTRSQRVHVPEGTEIDDGTDQIGAPTATIDRFLYAVSSIGKLGLLPEWSESEGVPLA